MTDTVTVELTHREARALVRSADLFSVSLSDVFGPHRDVPEGCNIRPLESASMKLQTALVIEQAEV